VEGVKAAEGGRPPAMPAPTSIPTPTSTPTATQERRTKKSSGQSIRSPTRDHWPGYYRPCRGCGANSSVVGHGVDRFNFFFDSSPFLYEIVFRSS